MHQRVISLRSGETHNKNPLKRVKLQQSTALQQGLTNAGQTLADLQLSFDTGLNGIAIVGCLLTSVSIAIFPTICNAYSSQSSVARPT